MAITLSTREPDFETAFAALLAQKRETDPDVDDAVAHSHAERLSEFRQASAASSRSEAAVACSWKTSV